MSASYKVNDYFLENGLVNEATYRDMYERSVEDNEGFWADQGRRLDWIEPYTKVKDVSYAKGDLHIRWYEDGTLNACYNCVDRHLEDKADQTAIIWEGDEPDVDAKITYSELHAKVSKMANVFKKHGVGKGDRVAIYMPMIPEAAYAMLACARIGAVHSIVFGGFSPDALSGRIIDCEAKLVITTDEGKRGGRKVPLKDNVDAACAIEGTMDSLQTVVVIKHTGGDIEWTDADRSRGAAGVEMKRRVPKAPETVGAGAETGAVDA